MKPIHNSTAEYAVIARLINKPDVYIDIAHWLKPDHFYIADCREAYKIFLELADKNQGLPPDWAMWQTALRKAGVVTDEKNILLHAPNQFQLEASLPTQIKASATEIVTAYKRRYMQKIAHELDAMAVDPETPLEQMLALTQSAMDDQTYTPDDLPKSVQYHLGEAQKTPVIYRNLGLTDVDSLTGGVPETALVILAARPGMGKTALMIELALKNARYGAVLIFSVEMTAALLVYRILSNMAKVDAKLIAKHENQAEDFTLSPIESNRLELAKHDLSQLPIYIDETTGATPTYIRSKAKALQVSRPDLCMIMVDYLQLMHSDRIEQTRALEVGKMSSHLKNTAKWLNVKTVLLSQLSRQTEARRDKRPQLADLKDSGSIEQDGDMVIFIYRDEYYNPDDTTAPNIAEINVAKNRHGKTGMREMYFEGKHMRFLDLDKRPFDPPSAYQNSSAKDEEAPF